MHLPSPCSQHELEDAAKGQRLPGVQLLYTCIAVKWQGALQLGLEGSRLCLLCSCWQRVADWAAGFLVQLPLKLTHVVPKDSKALLLQLSDTQRGISSCHQIGHSLISTNVKSNEDKVMYDVRLP